MANILGRINKLEKQAIPQVKREVIPILTKAWREAGKTYYLDSKGETKEYIEKDNHESPIFTYVNNKKEAMTND